MNLKEALRYNYLLAGLSPEEIDRVAEVATLKEVDGGTLLVRQFDKNSDVMVVIEGQVRINTFHGEKITEGGPGSIVGEMSLIDDKPRSATVVAIGHCKVGVIPATHLWKLMLDDPILARKILFNIAQVLSTRLRAANVHLDTLMGKAGS